MSDEVTDAQVDALGYRPCVGIMLINGQGHIWAGQRIDSPGRTDAWQMPQGGVDKGEPREDAAFRELEEETSVPRSAVTLLAQTSKPVRYELPRDLIAKLWKGRYRGQEQHWFLMRLDGSEDLINIETDEPEFLRWRWMPYAELIAHVVPFKTHVYEAAWQAFGPQVEAQNA